MTKSNPWIIAQLEPNKGEENLPPMYAILPDDGSNGLLIGEMWEVIHLRNSLTQLIDTLTPDETIDNMDEQLGWKWLTVTEASREFDIPASTIRRWMPRMQHAKKMDGRWIAPAVIIRGYVVKHRTFTE